MGGGDSGRKGNVFLFLVKYRICHPVRCVCLGLYTPHRPPAHELPQSLTCAKQKAQLLYGVYQADLGIDSLFTRSFPLQYYRVERSRDRKEKAR